MMRVSLIVTLNKFIIESLLNILSKQTYKYKIETNNKIVGILVVFASQYCHFEEREIALETQQQCVNLACDFSFLEMTNDSLNI